MQPFDFSPLSVPSAGIMENAFGHELLGFGEGARGVIDDTRQALTVLRR